jgi:dolichyl-phosphate-mannose--protein O-mannosyl transferase
MIKTLRWLLVLPAAYGGWLIAFLVGLELHGLIDYFCPVEYRLSGSCQYPAAHILEEMLIAVCSAASACLVIVFATITAPAYKPRVAAVTLFLGLVVASWAYLQTSALGAFTGACLAGAMTFWLVIRRVRRKSASCGYQYELFI